ncbi:Fructosamine-3-kinase [Candidatus Rubidus massiliensis]|nr:Fructosamine-3-kinase [Candidatus Rubidus massiliensis]
MPLQQKIIDALLSYINLGEVESCEIVPKSSLNECYKITTSKGNFFIKTSVHPNAFAMYEAETKSLHVIDSTATLRVPCPIFHGKEGKTAFLVMEYLELQSHSPKSMRSLGYQLAKMHLTGTNRAFGFELNNTLGLTPQINHWSQSWVYFFKEQRISFQLQLIEDFYQDKEIAELGKDLLSKIHLYFEGITITPSLLHGDLWMENTAVDLDGNCVVFDPAAYYGHHEADLGICHLFGGFSDDFYEGYHSLIPKQMGYEERSILYQLYHALNHYNLFGKSYRNVCLNLFHQLSKTI